MMEMKPTKTPELKSRLPLSFLSGFVFMVAVMLALPFTQRMTTPDEPPIIVDPLTEIDSPEDFKVPPPPPKVDDPDIDLVEDPPEKPLLNPLDIPYGTDMDSVSSTDWRVFVGNGPSTVDIIVDIGDLTDPPHPIRRQQPMYPAELKRVGIEGTVLVMFVVRSNGTVTNVEIKKATHPAFAESVRRAVRKWFFEAGEKDGKAVNTRVRQAIPFRINNNSF